MRNVAKNKSIIQLFLGVATVFTIYLTFGFSTKTYENSLLSIAHVIGCVVVGLLYFEFDKISKYDMDKYTGDIGLFNGIMLYITLLYMIGGTVEFIVDRTEVYKLISKIIFFGIFLIIHIVNHRNRLSVSVLLRNWRLIVLLVIVSIVMYEPTMFSTRWDSILYYGDFSDINVYAVGDMSFFGHLAQGAGVFVNFFVTVALGHSDIGIFIANLASILIGIIAFYGAIKNLFPHRSERLYLLFTAGYAFLPCVLGLSSYINVDLFIINWFMVLVYLYIAQKYFLFSVVGFLYVFTKEPAIVIYGGLCIGILIIDYLSNGWNIVRHLRYYGMLTVAAIWGITAIINGIWTLPGSGAGVSSVHIIRELKLFFIFNFNWIIWCLIILIGIVLFTKRKTIKEKTALLKIMPIAVSIVFFIGVNIVFVTACNPRYIDNVIVGAYFILTVLLMCLCEIGYPFICIFLSSLVLLLMLISSFVTIDPISLAKFGKVRLGNSYILSAMSSFTLGDSCVYNKQGQYIEGAYDKAVEFAIDNDCTIIIDEKEGTSYGVDGMHGIVLLQSGYEEYMLLYDTKKCRRTLIENADTVQYKTVVVTDEESIKNCIKEDQMYLYIYVDGYSEANKEFIASKYSSCKSHEFSYKGISFYGISFEID